MVDIDKMFEVGDVGAFYYTFLGNEHASDVHPCLVIDCEDIDHGMQRVTVLPISHFLPPNSENYQIIPTIECRGIGLDTTAPQYIFFGQFGVMEVPNHVGRLSRPGKSKLNKSSRGFLNGVSQKFLALGDAAVAAPQEDL